MKRTVYEAPLTELFRVELESGFCSGSADVENPNDAKVGQIDEHATNTGFGSGGIFDAGTWDSENQ